MIVIVILYRKFKKNKIKQCKEDNNKITLNLPTEIIVNMVVYFLMVLFVCVCAHTLAQISRDATIRKKQEA